MKTVIFILGGKTDGDVPRERFALRLDWALRYHREHRGSEDITFLVSGRCGNVNDGTSITEAEVGKRHIVQSIPNARVIKEDISVDMIGNFAFSKPLIRALNPDQVIITTSSLFADRVRYLADKVFSRAFHYTFQGIDDELTGDEALIKKETYALKLLRKLIEGVDDGDDAAIREILLYKTPYYFKCAIDDKTFFDTYWEGGFDHFLSGLRVRNSK